MINRYIIVKQHMTVQNSCDVEVDVAVIWLYDFMGTCTIRGLLCYGTTRYGHLVQVVG
jgi:hypothetical protein